MNELNAYLAEHLFGWEHAEVIWTRRAGLEWAERLPDYADTYEGMGAVEQRVWEQYGALYVLERSRDPHVGYRAAFFMPDDPQFPTWGEGATAPLATARAYLAFLVRRGDLSVDEAESLFVGEAR